MSTSCRQATSCRKTQRSFSGTSQTASRNRNLGERGWPHWTHGHGLQAQASVALIDPFNDIHIVGEFLER